MAGKVWKKEDELKQLKTELATLDRKIQLELTPPTPSAGEPDKEQQQEEQTRKPEMQQGQRPNMIPPAYSDLICNPIADAPLEIKPVVKGLKI